MTTVIQQLPTPPTPADTPTEFNSKAFSLLGALPGFVTQANQLGSEMTTLGQETGQDAEAARLHKEAAAGSAGAAAGSAGAASASAGQAAGSAGDAATYRLAALGAATRAEAAAGGMEQAIAMAATFTAVPTTFQAMVIVVTQPHMRLMQWSGTKYVRSPLAKMPGEYFYAHDPLGKITHGIQVRTDVTYNRADHPDLAEYLGVTTATFVLPGDGRARVLRGADLGAGIDAALVDGAVQGDAGRNLTGETLGYASGVFSGELEAIGAFGRNSVAADSILRGDSVVSAVSSMRLVLDAARQWPTANEFRVKSLVARLYITR